MSFDIKGPSPKFGIQEAQNMKNNGGGGNLGYFQRRKKEEDEKKKKKTAGDIFDFSLKNDEFILEADFNQAEKDILQKAAELITKFKTKRQGA